MLNAPTARVQRGSIQHSTFNIQHSFLPSFSLSCSLVLEIRDGPCRLFWRTEMLNVACSMLNVERANGTRSAGIHSTLNIQHSTFLLTLLFTFLLTCFGEPGWSMPVVLENRNVEC